MYGGIMNKVQRNAKAFSKLLDKEYIFYLGFKGKCRKVVFRFEKKNFNHLEGIGQLTDIMLHSEPADKIFTMAIEGEIKEEMLEASVEYKKGFVERKLNHLYLLEEFIDNNEVIFNYIKNNDRLISESVFYFLIRFLLFPLLFVV